MDELGIIFRGISLHRLLGSILRLRAGRLFSLRLVGVGTSILFLLLDWTVRVRVNELRRILRPFVRPRRAVGVRVDLAERAFGSRHC